MSARSPKRSKSEREKRHFPELQNRPGKQSAKPRGRKYMGHGYGDDPDWKPQVQHRDPAHTEFGPDWKSRVRYIPSPNQVGYKTESWPDSWYKLRSFPSKSKKSGKEYSFYPDPPSGFGVAKRCVFDGVHQRTYSSGQEVTDSMLFGKHKKVSDPRGGLRSAAPGDKVYQAVEYSPNFHKLGTTLPVVNFGGRVRETTDTFIPLHDLPPGSRESYWIKEKKRRKESEVSDVRDLEVWKPAPSLVQACATLLPCK